MVYFSHTAYDTDPCWLAAGARVECGPGYLDNVMAHLRHTVYFTDLCWHAVQARVPRTVKRLSEDLGDNGYREVHQA